MKDGSNTRAVVLFPGALGDLVLARAALAALRSRHMGRLVVAVQGSLRALAAAVGLADQVASLDDADAAGLFGGTRMPAWFGTRPDLYAWLGSRDPAVGARLRSLAGRAEFFAVVRGDDDVHAADEYLSQVGAGGDVGRSMPPRWPVPTPTARVAAIGGDGPLLVVHPGAGSAAKRWPAVGFRLLVARWQEAGGIAAEIVGPAESDLAAVGATHRIVEWALPEVAALLARSAAYAGNDSGVSHLAAAVGARGIAVFGPTRSRRWGPGGRIVAIDTERAFSGDAVAIRREFERAWSALGGAGCLDKLGGHT